MLQGFVLFVGGIPFTGDVQVFSSCLGGTSSSLLTTKTDKQCNICPAGTYANTGSLQCMICPPGNFCPYEGTTSPIPAPSGWYIPSAGSVVQYSYMCEYAYYCPTGSVNQILCPAGSYCNTVAMQYPNNCSFGYYNNKVGSYSQSDCIICPAGYYCNKEIGASDIIP